MTAIVDDKARSNTPLMEMYLAGVSARRIGDTTKDLRCTKVSAGVVSKLNQELYDKIYTWRSRSIEGTFPCILLGGIVLKRTWVDEIRNVSILVAFGVDGDGYREILEAQQGAKEDKAGWGSFVASLKQRGLASVQLFISGKYMGLVESLAEYYLNTVWQRYAVHFNQNMFINVPYAKMNEVAFMLKAIHAQEDREA